MEADINSVVRLEERLESAYYSILKQGRKPKSLVEF
jgi:hypothetical protein